ncbi:MAG: long-chain fatty acid--CoA ligase, partial [Candidatus Marinimicrobia bacterium]|nr:long-chain fatty acid--CoA ligase [Candidatus Neomarinimicrobiota bacterium]
MFLKNHNKTAFIWKDQKISYEEFLEQVDRYARLLQDQKGSKVAIFSENRPEWAYAFYASWKKSFIAVPIDFMSEPAEVKYILEDCRPANIFCSKARLEKLEEALQKLSYEPEIFVFEELELPQKANPDFPRKDKDDVATLIYTSGTTGSPKGVMLT